MRFQPATPSSGKKKGVMPCSAPERDYGALRNHASLNARTESWLSNPFGTHGGAARTVRGEYTRGRPRSFGGRSSSVAWLPLVITDRPRCVPRATQSIHATEYR